MAPIYSKRRGFNTYQSGNPVTAQQRQECTVIIGGLNPHQCSQDLLLLASSAANSPVGSIQIPVGVPVTRFRMRT